MSLAVVTGGGVGIDATCAIQMASAGHNVVARGRRATELGVPAVRVGDSKEVAKRIASS